jgi:RNA polymerase sigma-70 factor (ECF subfamily)
MWPEPPETGVLLEQVRGGDRAALERLLSRHREPVRRLLQLRLDPALAARVDASDIVQEVLFEAIRRLSEYLQEPRLPFHMWLRHIARDHIIDAHRRHRQAARRTVDRERPLAARVGSPSSLEWASALIDAELTPATAALRKELEGRFQEALGRLGEEDR